MPKTPEPIVAVNNIAEAFHPFFSRGKDREAVERLLEVERCHNDRVLMWKQDTKLAICDFPIAHADWFRRQYAYQGTLIATPQSRSHSLCSDIVRDAALCERIVRYAAGNALAIVPYAATPEYRRMVEFLVRQYGLAVNTPESPADFALRDWLDTKWGFYRFIKEMPEDLRINTPATYVCDGLGGIGEVLQHFLRAGQSCVVKANTGEGGLGQEVVRPSQSLPSALKRINDNPFLHGDTMVVQEYISDAVESPSFEYYVPPAADGPPRMTYTCLQLCTLPGQVDGLLVERSLQSRPWFKHAAAVCDRIATVLQQRGYVGFFDIDCVTDRKDELFMLEMNPRRTSGTHVHEFATKLFGLHYLDELTVLAADSVSCSPEYAFEDILELLGPVLLAQGQRTGVVVSETTGLANGRLGVIIFAPGMSQASELLADVRVRVN